jgi:hypothetical protein
MFLNSPKKKPGENPVTRSGSEYKTPPIVSREGGESNRVREEVMEKNPFFYPGTPFSGTIRFLLWGVAALQTLDRH